MDSNRYAAFLKFLYLVAGTHFQKLLIDFEHLGKIWRPWSSCISNYSNSPSAIVKPLLISTILNGCNKNAITGFNTDKSTNRSAGCLVLFYN